MLLAPVEYAVVRKGANLDFSHPNSNAQRLVGLRLLVTAGLGLAFGVRVVICKATAQPLSWSACQYTLPLNISAQLL